MKTIDTQDSKLVLADILNPPPSRNQFTRDYLTLTGGGYEYNIHRSRIDTAGKVVHWLTHLSSKQWFTIEDMKDVLSFAKQQGVNPWAEAI